MADVTIRLDGWGQNSWGNDPWGETSSGVEATGGVGQVTLAGDSSVTVTGVEATTAVGSVLVNVIFHVTVNLTGIAATTSIGGATGSIPVTIPLEGWGIGDWGDAGWGYSNAGSQATGEVGTVTQSTSITVVLTGVEATGQVSGTSMWIEIVPAQTPNWVPMAA